MDVEIRDLIIYAENFGFSVDLEACLPGNILGQISYNERIVSINKYCPKIRLIPTFIHEIGHMLSFIRIGMVQGKGQPDKGYRETLAYLYGWVAIRELGININKEEWRSLEGV